MSSVAYGLIAREVERSGFDNIDHFPILHVYMV